MFVRVGFCNAEEVLSACLHSIRGSTAYAIPLSAGWLDGWNGVITPIDCVEIDGARFIKASSGGVGPLAPRPKIAGLGKVGQLGIQLPLPVKPTRY